ncbi:MBL fold metallo-hydrolase [Leptospira borgpetersenii serovar Hardjo-bovis]|nr:hydroxyacylglutathione hydrolase [Leptospira borgpetersenii serovar Hardjo-bovis]AYR08443.1 MBL fold metallo-hydrolase [Leptospira borgpetersenii serovar Hardjo-bovis]TQE55221.1 MBL fold metallo-hydrolase [Leptospira borgpetersenii]TQE59472.1 MBL fold metallo-hydrolase [Leptospira borgpetersenii]
MDSKGWTLDFLLNTHEHEDHTSGNTGLVQRYGCTVYSHPEGIGKIPHATHPLKKGDFLLRSSKEYLEILDTPGHTFCHVCLLLVENQKPKAIFTGDTIFNAGVGNCHHGGDPEVLAKTILEQFYPLEEEILLYPGHDYLETNLKFTLSLDPSNQDAIRTLEECSRLSKNVEFLTTDLRKERKINTFFQCDKPSLELRKNVSKKIPFKQLLDNDPTSFFISLRSLRDQW